MRTRVKKKFVVPQEAFDEWWESIRRNISSRLATSKEVIPPTLYRVVNTSHAGIQMRAPIPLYTQESAAATVRDLHTKNRVNKRYLGAMVVTELTENLPEEVVDAEEGEEDLGFVLMAFSSWSAVATKSLVYPIRRNNDQYGKPRYLTEEGYDVKEWRTSPEG